MATAQRSDFGDLLKRHRQAAGLTQEALSERSGIDERTISDLERGARRAVYQDTVAKLTGGLSLSPQDSAEFEQIATAQRVRSPRTALNRRESVIHHPGESPAIDQSGSSGRAEPSTAGSRVSAKPLLLGGLAGLLVVLLAGGALALTRPRATTMIVVTATTSGQAVLQPTSMVQLATVTTITSAPTTTPQLPGLPPVTTGAASVTTPALPTPPVLSTSASSSQVPASTPGATAISGNIIAVGQVPADMPGFPIAPGMSVTSVVRPPREVYAIPLTAGQQLEVVVRVNNDPQGILTVHIALPGAPPFKSNSGAVLCQTNLRTTLCSPPQPYLAQYSGTYHLAVSSLGSGYEYTMSISVK